MYKYKCCIIGAGSIGALKDYKYDSIDSKDILTWAHAIYKHPEIELVRIIDKDIEKAYKAAMKWKCGFDEYYSRDIDDSDIVIVATPTNTHKKVLLEVLKYNPKIVIAEKPFCSNSEEAREVFEVYHEAGIPIIVDYIRAFDLRLCKIINSLNEGVYGKIYSVICYYVRGFKHECCHAIEMFNRMLGEFIGGDTLITEFQDNPNSKSFPVVMAYEKCKNVFCIPIDSRSAYNVFNIEIMTDRGKIILSEHGKFSEFYNAMPEPTYGNYKTLSAWPVSRIKTELTTDMMRVLDEAVSYLNHETDRVSWMSCLDIDAIKVHEVIENILGE